MTTSTSRRAILAAASAISVVSAVAVPSLANAAPGADAELLRLGVQLNRIGEEWLAQQLSDARRRAAWEEACIQAGLPRLAHGSVPVEEWRERNAKRHLVRDDDRDDEHDEHGVNVAWESVHDRLIPLLDEILSYEAQTLAGLAVKTHAFALQNFDWWDDEDEERNRQFLESLCSFLGITPVVIRFARSPEFSAAYGEQTV